MILRFVIEVKPIIEPAEESKEWAYKYYGGIIQKHLEKHFKGFKIYGFNKGTREIYK